MLPWIHLSIQPDKEILPCCVSSSSCGYFGDKPLSEVWNSEELKKLRVNMLHGIPSPNCEYCYTSEKVGQKSTRQFVNKKYKHHFNIVKTTKQDGTVDKLNLIYWDFRFSNLCNFKCRMCGPTSSTSWYSDDIKLNGTNYDEKERIAKIDILDELEPLYDNVEEIYFAGGEPLIMKEHYYILEKLIQLKKTNVTISYSTNLSVLNYKGKDILDIWKKFKNIDVSISLDGYGKRGEIIRSGLKWDLFLKNLVKFKKEVPHVNYSIACTAQALNGFHIMNLQKKLYQSGLLRSVDDFVVQFLKDPEILSLWILDKKTKTNLCQKINEHISDFLIPLGSKSSLNEYRSMIDYINLEDRSNLIPEFLKYCSSLDSIRNEDTKKTFPELKNLWDIK